MESRSYTKVEQITESHRSLQEAFSVLGEMHVGIFNRGACERNETYSTHPHTLPSLLLYTLVARQLVYTNTIT